MKTVRFHTSINCGGCVAAVTPYLDNVAGVTAWRVDTDSKDKVLTVEGDFEAADVMAQVRAAGFDVTPAKKKLFGPL